MFCTILFADNTEVACQTFEEAMEAVHAHKPAPPPEQDDDEPDLPAEEFPAADISRRGQRGVLPHHGNGDEYEAVIGRAMGLGGELWRVLEAFEDPHRANTRRTQLSRVFPHHLRSQREGTTSRLLIWTGQGEPQ